MKNVLLIFTAVLLSATSFAQNSMMRNGDHSAGVSIGVLQAGSIVGVDIEHLIHKNFGLQVGAGILGFDCGFNLHLKPTVQSSFISLTYVQQGINNSFSQSFINLGVGYRHRIGFTMQLGLGSMLKVSDLMRSTMKDRGYPNYDPKMIITYSIGWSFGV